MLSDYLKPPKLPYGRQVLVLAGTKEQAREWAKKTRLANNEWIYVSPSSIRGFSKPYVYLVGTWHLRSDLLEIESALIPCQPRIMILE